MNREARPLQSRGRGTPRGGGAKTGNVVEKSEPRDATIVIGGDDARVRRRPECAAGPFRHNLGTQEAAIAWQFFLPNVAL